jgi:toxin ParE1/3/4
MTSARLTADPRAELDVVAAFEWYDRQRTGLGAQFLRDLRATYRRIAESPLRYHDLQSGIRRALLQRFPYAVYFFVDDGRVVVLAVLHASRDPAEWQRRGR